MRHVYSIVRFVPDPGSGECVNLGLLAGSEDSDEWVLQTVSQRSRARQLDRADVLPGVAGFLERMTAELEDYTEAHAGGQLELLGGAEPLHEDWLIRLAGEQRGVVQFTEPQPVDVASANEAIELLWDELIIEPSRRTYPFLKKHTALGAVRAALRKVNIREEHLWRAARLESKGFRAPVDFAVHNGQVAYLTQCWSFQLPDKERLLDEVQSWAWAVRSLRRHGGRLSVDSPVWAAVPDDVGLGIVYVPPANDEDRQAFEKAEEAFRDPDVNASRVVSFEAASEVAIEALAALGSVSR